MSRIIQPSRGEVLLAHVTDGVASEFGPEGVIKGHVPGALDGPEVPGETVVARGVHGCNECQTLDPVR